MPRSPGRAVLHVPRRIRAYTCNMDGKTLLPLSALQLYRRSVRRARRAPPAAATCGLWRLESGTPRVLSRRARAPGRWRWSPGAPPGS
eukprot:6431698-Prymnesium_polylepis.1